MIVDIAVDSGTNYTNKIYSYIVPTEFEKNILVGQTVEIPFGKRILSGIILSVSDKEQTYKLKEIIKINKSIAPLTQNQISLARWISYTYANSLNSSLKLFQYEEDKLSSEILEKDPNIISKIKVKLNEEQLKVVDEINKGINSNNNKDKIFLLHGVTGSGKTEVYIRITEEILKKGNQVLILVPEIALTPQTIKKFSEIFGKSNIATINSFLSIKERIKNFHDISTNSKSIIIGARSAIFAPFKSLGAIIIDECHESSFYQNNKPSYNTINIAFELNKELNIPIILGSATPLIEQYYDFSKEYKILKLRNKISNRKVLTKIEEFNDKTKSSIITPTLLEELKLVLNKGEQALIYLNRRGYASSIICLDCKRTFMCNNCSVPINLHIINKKKYLICHYCYSKISLSENCIYCNSFNIRTVGKGNEKVIDEIKTHFKENVIEIMNRDMINKKNSHEMIYKRLSENKIDILVGTQMITKGIDIGNIGLTCYLNLDSDLIFPSYKTRERVFQNIIQLSGRSGRQHNQGINIIQTFNKNNKIIEEAINNNWDEFYLNELKIRKSLGYPPYSQLIQIISKNKDIKSSLKNIKTQIRTISKILEAINIKDSVTLLGPSKCNYFKVNNNYFMQITLKIHNKIVFDKIVEEINSMKIENGVKININPFDLA